jgi:cytoskeleton protein RodZ
MRCDLEDGRKTEDGKSGSAEGSKGSTSNPDTEIEFGTWLKSKRESVRVPLEEIAAITKVHIAQLKMIEDNHWKGLPAPAFVRGFLLCYARHIGLDEDEVLRRYRKSLGKSDLSQSRGFPSEALPSDRVRVVGSPNFKSSPAARDLDKIRPAMLTPKRVSIVAAVVAVIVLISFLISVGKKDKSNQAVVTERTTETVPTSPSFVETPSSTSTDDKKTAPPVEAAKVPTETAAVTPVVANDLKIALKAIEQTWVSVRSDNQESKGQLFKPGMRMAFEAKNKIDLVLSNAGAIEIEYKGKRYFAPGFRGDVVKMSLPSDADKLKEKIAAPRQGVIPSRTGGEAPTVLPGTPSTPSSTPAPTQSPGVDLDI